jgi:hypothetical protein
LAVAGLSFLGSATLASLLPRKAQASAPVAVGVHQPQATLEERRLTIINGRVFEACLHH